MRTLFVRSIILLYFKVCSSLELAFYCSEKVVSELLKIFYSQSVVESWAKDFFQKLV